MVQINHSAHDAGHLKFETPPHVLVIEARFYNEINDHLIDGTMAALKKVGATSEVITVPGALEIPSALQFAAQTEKYDAYVVLGCVIRGETTHYEIVSNESARGVMDVALAYDLPVGNGILTVENVEQAMDRADKSRQDKGGGAATAALMMLKLKQNFEGKTE